MGKAQVLQKKDKSEKPKLKKSVLTSKTKTVVKERKKKSWSKPLGGKGVVYLSHIPHGFYEDQIESYFKQFGKVTAVSVPRSKTGRMRGYAFIEFQHPEVAQIAADTMNNYLMFNRLLKAKYIPPEEQKPKYFLAARAAQLTHTTAAEKAALMVVHNRKLKNRKLKLDLEAKQASKLLRREKLLKKRLEKLGLDYNFQVQEGGAESIFKLRKEQKKNKKDAVDSVSAKEDLPSEDDEELSSIESDEDVLSFDDMETSDDDETDERVTKINNTKKSIKKTLYKKPTQGPVLSMYKPKQKLNKIKANENKKTSNMIKPLKQKNTSGDKNVIKEVTQVIENNTAPVLKLGSKNKKSKQVPSHSKQHLKKLPISNSSKSSNKLTSISSGLKKPIVKLAPKQPTNPKEINLLSNKIFKKSNKTSKNFTNKPNKISLSPVSPLKLQKKPRHRVLKKGSVEK